MTPRARELVRDHPVATSLALVLALGWIQDVLLFQIVCPYVGRLLEDPGLTLTPLGVVVAPVLVPALVTLGFDPLHIAILMIVTLNVANVTPPVGMSLMTAAWIAKVPYERAIVASLPFYISFFVVIVLLALFPGLSTWIPSLLK